MTDNDIVARIEHSLLGAAVTRDDIKRICYEAVEYGFYSVCVNPVHVKLAAETLQTTPVKITTVAGFPLGASIPHSKVHEAVEAVADGAHEVDMVMNIGAAIEGRWDAVQQGIADMRSAISESVLKVIIECCYLDEPQKIGATEIALRSGADYVKTSTGFGTSGATVEDVALIKDVLDGRARIKAAGGIKTLADYKAMIEAGADLIGSSSGIAIMKEAGITP